MTRPEEPLFATARITRTATKAELDAAEAILGPLPPSYRRFAEQYGAGLTNGLMIVFMPFSSPAIDLVVRGRQLMKRTQLLLSGFLEDGATLGGEDCLEPYDEESQGVGPHYEELVFFARSENGESFAWWRRDGAYTFFSIDRACLSVRYGGSDLFEMIRRMQTLQVKQVLGSRYEPLPSTFVGYELFPSRFFDPM